MPALPAPGRASALGRSSSTFAAIPRASSVPRAVPVSAVSSCRTTSSSPLSRRRLSHLLASRSPRASSGTRRAMSAPQAAAGESCCMSIIRLRFGANRGTERGAIRANLLNVPEPSIVRSRGLRTKQETQQSKKMGKNSTPTSSLNTVKTH